MNNSKELDVFLQRYNLTKFKFTLLKDGISNINYALDKKYALKVPYDKRFISLKPYQIELQKIAAKYFISPNVLFWDIENGFLVTELLNGYEPISPLDINFSQVKKIVKLIKAYEKLDVSKIDVPKLNYQKMLDDFRLQVNPKDRIYLQKLENSKLLKSNTTLTHFDMVNNNILSDKNSNIQLIDFEFACIAPEYFDLVSLLSENKFAETKQQIIINEYFVEDPEGLKRFLIEKNELRALFDLLWYHWAAARSNVEDEKYKNIYLQIASDKKVSLLRCIHQIRY